MHETARDRDVEAATETLARTLDALDPRRGLARFPGAADAQAPWRQAEAYPYLLAIARDPRREDKTRFLAAEFAFEHDFLRLPSEDFPALAEVYARALRENLSGSMADWGFEHDPLDTGRFGSRLVYFGNAAIPALSSLLDAAREVAYAYPSEFPSVLRTGMQIRDFAMLYLAAILHVPMPPLHGDAERDAFVRELRTRLP